MFHRIRMLLVHIQSNCQAKTLLHFCIIYSHFELKKKHRERNPSQAGGRDSFNVIILASDMMALWTILT